MTSEVPEKGTYVCRHHSIVSIRFVEIDELTLASFNHQNALMGLEIEDISSRQQERVKLSVHFDAAWGVGCEFICHSAEVLSVEPGIPAGSVYT